MKKSKDNNEDDLKVLPKHIAEMPELQREDMQRARKEGTFDGKAHLAKSTMINWTATAYVSCWSKQAQANTILDIEKSLKT